MKDPFVDALLRARDTVYPTPDYVLSDEQVVAICKRLDDGIGRAACYDALSKAKLITMSKSSFLSIIGYIYRGWRLRKATENAV